MLVCKVDLSLRRDKKVSDKQGWVFIPAFKTEGDKQWL